MNNFKEVATRQTDGKIMVTCYYQGEVYLTVREGEPTHQYYVDLAKYQMQENEKEKILNL